MKISDLKLPNRKTAAFSEFSEFELEKEIGSGGFSKVFLARHKSSGVRYALKRIDLSQLSIVNKENIEKEIEAHLKVSHPYVIRLIDFFPEGLTKLNLVLELCMRGNLFQYLVSRKTLPDAEVRKIFRQTCLAISHIHSCGYILRDLKPENVLLDDNGDIKICDFGWCASLQDNEFRRAKAGTYAYMSPESLRGELQDERTDIWSLGVFLYELYQNKEPFTASNYRDQLRNIMLGPPAFCPNRRTPPAAKKLILEILNVDVNKRPSLASILNSTFLRESVGEEANIPSGFDHVHKIIEVPNFIEGKIACNKAPSETFPNQVSRRIVYSVDIKRQTNGFVSRELIEQAKEKKTPINSIYYNFNEQNTTSSKRNLYVDSTPGKPAGSLMTSLSHGNSIIPVSNDSSFSLSNKPPSTNGRGLDENIYSLPILKDGQQDRQADQKSMFVNHRFNPPQLNRFGSELITSPQVEIYKSVTISAQVRQHLPIDLIPAHKHEEQRHEPEKDHRFQTIHDNKPDIIKEIKSDVKKEFRQEPQIQIRNEKQFNAKYDSNREIRIGPQLQLDSLKEFRSEFPAGRSESEMIPRMVLSPTISLKAAEPVCARIIKPGEITDSHNKLSDNVLKKAVVVTSHIKLDQDDNSRKQCFDELMRKAKQKRNTPEKKKRKVVEIDDNQNTTYNSPDRLLGSPSLNSKFLQSDRLSSGAVTTNPIIKRFAFIVDQKQSGKGSPPKGNCPFEASSPLITNVKSGNFVSSVIKAQSNVECSWRSPERKDNQTLIDSKDASRPLIETPNSPVNIKESMIGQPPRPRVEYISPKAIRQTPQIVVHSPMQTSFHPSIQPKIIKTNIVDGSKPLKVANSNKPVNENMNVLNQNAYDSNQNKQAEEFTPNMIQKFPKTVGLQLPLTFQNRGSLTPVSFACSPQQNQLQKPTTFTEELSNRRKDLNGDKGGAAPPYQIKFNNSIFRTSPDINY